MTCQVQTSLKGRMEKIEMEKISNNIDEKKRDAYNNKSDNAIPEGAPDSL